VQFYDAHNHLQDDRLKACLPEILKTLWSDKTSGVTSMVVNGSCEEDWADVAALAREHPQIIPSFGIHPWYVKTRTSQWRENLESRLKSVPSAVGEIGLDRWISDYNLPDQEEVFLWQLRFATNHGLPVTIHCLRAWGRMEELLKKEQLPKCGFLLHSYGGPVEMVKPLVQLGAYFSFPGYFARANKERQRETFRAVPRERLLIETDAPDQILPEPLIRYPLAGPDGKPVNHPANLPAIYEFTAQFLGVTMEELASQVEENFKRLFCALK